MPVGVVQYAGHFLFGRFDRRRRRLQPAVELVRPVGAAGPIAAQPHLGPVDVEMAQVLCRCGNQQDRGR